MNWEIAFLQWLQTAVCGHNLNGFMQFFTTIGNGALVWILLCILLLLFPQTRRYGLIATLALFLNGLLCNGILKPLIDRPRPFTQVEVDLLIPPPGQASFPSGHTSSSFAVATVIYFWSRKWGFAALIVAAVISFSRLYFFVHYPTDIAGGIIVGIGSAFLAAFLVAQVEKKKSPLKSGKA